MSLTEVRVHVAIHDEAKNSIKIKKTTTLFRTNNFQEQRVKCEQSYNIEGSIKVRFFECLHNMSSWQSIAFAHAKIRYKMWELGS